MSDRPQNWPYADGQQIPIPKGALVVAYLNEKPVSISVMVGALTVARLDRSDIAAAAQQFDHVRKTRT
jgi:hypothetical protein